MMPAVTQMGGMALAFPDVCKTIVGPAVVPIPYPNISTPSMMIPGTGTVKTFTMAMPTAVMMSQHAMTSGDEAGVAGGVVSQAIKMPAGHLLGSTGVLFEARPVAYTPALTGHNGVGALNAPPGATLVPSQVKVLVRP